MATTSFIYHMLGLEHYRHLKTEFKNGAVYHHVKRKADERYCAPLGNLTEKPCASSRPDMAGAGDS